MSNKKESTKAWRIAKGEFLPPETKSVMASYKEPLKPVTEGYGYYGTIAYDESQKYTQCHLCGNFYKTLGVHVAKAHKRSSREYRIEFGLPVTLTLTAPKARNKNYEVWASLTDEQKKSQLANLKKGHRVMGKGRPKALYYKNIEGRCPDQLLEKIESLADKLGRAPSRREFAKEYGGAIDQSVYLTFGSWLEAIKILNLKPASRGNKMFPEYDNETLLTLLFDFRDRYGREPMTTDTRRGLLPSQTTYRNHFGSWSKAKEYLK